jgi:hypothetical protein
VIRNKPSHHIINSTANWEMNEFYFFGVILSVDERTYPTIAKLLIFRQSLNQAAISFSVKINSFRSFCNQLFHRQNE